MTWPGDLSEAVRVLGIAGAQARSAEISMQGCVRTLSECGAPLLVDARGVHARLRALVAELRELTTQCELAGREHDDGG